MSKRNRNAKRQRYSGNNVVHSVGDSKPNEHGLFASDGFTNPMAFIGEASDLYNASTYVRHNVTLDYDMLTTLYRENWICKRIIDVPAEDMTRAWYSLSSQIGDGKEQELHHLESQHDIKGEIANAIRWARLYGGAVALIVISGQEDMLDEPLDYDMLQPGCFKGLLVLDRWQGVEPSIEIVQDMDDIDFGYPKYYSIYLDELHTTYQKVHHSRLIVFRGRNLPHNEEVSESYWGASEIEHVYEELQKRNTTSANMAQLVFHANVRTLKMSDFGEILAMGTKAQKQKVLSSIQEQNRLVSNFGLQVLSAEDSFENHPYSFGGLPELYEKFMADMAGAAEMPATKLYGRSPEGMNATGESDMNMYYESISQKQERILRPVLERLIPIECLSLWGVVPDDLDFEFEPIATVTPGERASIGSQITNNVVTAYNAGLIGRKTALMELRDNGKELGIWQKITDETIDEADDEVQGGEEDMGGDPMSMMGGMPGMGGAPEEPSDENAEPIEGKEVPASEALAKLQEPDENSANDSSVSNELFEKVAKLIQGVYGEKVILNKLQKLVKEEYGNDKPYDDAVVRLAELIQQEYGKKETEKDSLLHNVAELIEQEYGETDDNGSQFISAEDHRIRIADKVMSFFRKAKDYGVKGKSGNFGHKGRPGQRGGSGGGGGSMYTTTSANGYPMPKTEPVSHKPIKSV